MSALPEGWTDWPLREIQRALHFRNRDEALNYRTIVRIRQRYVDWRETSAQFQGQEQWLAGLAMHLIAIEIERWANQVHGTRDAERKWVKAMRAIERSLRQMAKSSGLSDKEPQNGRRVHLIDR